MKIPKPYCTPPEEVKAFLDMLDDIQLMVQFDMNINWVMNKWDVPASLIYRYINVYRIIKK